MPSELLTKREAADLLGVVPSTVQRMIDRGELHPVSSSVAGDRVLLYQFRRADVLRLVAKRAHPSAGAA